MADLIQERSTQRAQEVTNQDSFANAQINLESTALSRPLAMGSGKLKIGDRTESFSYEASAPVDGVSKLEINAAPGQELSPAGRIYSTIGAVWGLTRRLLAEHSVGLAATAAGLGLLGTPEKAEAVLMQTGTPESAYRQLGSDMAGELLSLRITNGVGVRNTSATYINSEYAITAAHNFTNLPGYPDPSITSEVATGSNYLTDRGTVDPIVSVTICPEYDGTFFSPDLAIIRFATPLAGQAVTIGSASVGDMVTAAGFGSYGYPGSTLSPQDGTSHGWQALALPGATDSNVSDTYYIGAPFGFNDGLTLNGRAAGGDSGGPWFNAAGQLVGISIAATLGTDSSGTTDFLNLSQPDVLNWIEANTIPTPEPSTMTLLVLGAGAAGAAGLLRRREEEVDAAR